MPGPRRPARHRLDADELRLQQLARPARATRREKAYAAAFVLLLIVIALNFAVDVIARRGGASVGLEATSAGEHDRGHRDPPGAARAADPPDRRRRAADRRTAATSATRQSRDRASAARRGPERMRSTRPDRLLRRARPRSSSVSLPIRQGEVLALIGPSGCGKTTLLRTLNRLTELTAERDAATGRIAARRRRRRHARGHRRCAAASSMVFQQPNPFPMSIFDNVAYALREQDAQAPGHARALEPPVERRAAPRRPVGRGRRRPRPARRCGCRAASSSGCASRARSPPSPRCC